MHIKRITLSGFKSYKAETIIEFEEGLNLIIGKNGHGKSNVFDAIRFVLGEQFGQLRADSQQKLIFVSARRAAGHTLVRSLSALTQRG
jgi:chromosome segregation ATPase